MYQASQEKEYQFWKEKLYDTKNLQQGLLKALS